jgi:hypothetical protein
MSTSWRAARTLLSGICIFGGADAARHPHTKVEAAQKVTDPLARNRPNRLSI